MLLACSIVIFSLAKQGIAMLITPIVESTVGKTDIQVLKVRKSFRAVSSTSVITDFAQQIPAGWTYYAYGPLQRQNDGQHSFCKVNGRTVSRCGLYTQVRDIEGGLDLSGFHSFRLTLKNLSQNTATVNPRLYMSWYDASENNALLHGYPELPTNKISLGQLLAGEVKTFDVSFTNMTFPEGYVFDHTTDLLAGVAVQAIDQDMGIVSIEVVSNNNAQVTRRTQQHSGGFIVLKKKSGAQHQIQDMNFDRPWGQPFRNLGYTIEPGDTIEVHGVVNSGFIFGVDGTSGDPITLIGATQDAAFDGKGASQLALNGGLVYVDGDYWNISNLEFRNCGLGYNGLDNAAGIKALGRNLNISHVTIHTCGHGYQGSPDNDNVLIENSEFFSNGYFGSGQHHNVYINGKNTTFRNNYSHHSHSQNFKNRGCNTLTEANFFKHAENMEVDYPGNAQHPNDCQHIFSGNVIVQDHYPDNRTQLITFFEDNYNLGKKPWKLFLVNNTVVGSRVVAPSLVRIGENKIVQMDNNIATGINEIQYQRGGPAERQNGVLGASHNNFLPESGFANNPELYRNLTASILGTDPGLDGNYYPMVNGVSHNSGYRDAVHLPLLHYSWPLSAVARPTDGTPDIGAFELGTPCVEDWVCGEWGQCLDGFQERACIDSNGCGTEILKPEERQECIVCVPEWECTDWDECYEGERNRDCYDIHECGVEDGKPEILEQCQVCTDGTVVLENRPDQVSNVVQSRLFEKYVKFAYDSPDNFIGKTGTYSSRYNLQFRDVVSALPPGTFLTKAELELALYKQTTPATVTVTPLAEDWESGHASWNLSFGAPDARHNMSPSDHEEVFWLEPGGTVDQSRVKTFSISPTGSNKITPRFDITEMAQSWINGDANYGVQLRALEGEITDLFGTNYYKNGQEYLGPRLSLEYSTCPQE